MKKSVICSLAICVLSSSFVFAQGSFQMTIPDSGSDNFSIQHNNVFEDEFVNLIDRSAAVVGNMFNEIPQNDRYKRRSSEIYPNYKHHRSRSVPFGENFDKRFPPKVPVEKKYIKVCCPNCKTEFRVEKPNNRRENKKEKKGKNRWHKKHFIFPLFFF